MPLQWRNYIWQSLEEGAGKRCSECAQTQECLQPCIAHSMHKQKYVYGRALHVHCIDTSMSLAMHCIPHAQAQVCLWPFITHPIDKYIINGIILHTHTHTHTHTHKERERERESTFLNRKGKHSEVHCPEHSGELVL